MELNEKIIAYILKEQYLRDFIEKNNIKFIQDFSIKKFIKTIIKFYKSYNKIPNIDEYERYISKVAEYNQFTIMFQKFLKFEPAENYTFLIDQLQSNYIKDNFSKILESVNFENIDIYEVHDKIAKLIRDIDSENTLIKERFIWEGADERYRKVQDGGFQFGISSGFKNFDEVTGGLNKKELYLFFGRSGIGKTRWLFNLAYNLSTNFYTGIYFSLEMYIEQMERIFDSRYGDINAEDIKYARVDKDKYSMILNEIKKQKYPLYIVEHPNRTRLEFIENKIREFKRNNKLDYIVVDYLNLCMTGKNQQTHEELGEISNILKNIAKKENIIVITAAQANRKTMETNAVGLEHIGYSDQIAHNADFVGYIKRGKMVDKILDIVIVKNREGKNNITIKFIVDFAKNAITDTFDIKMKENEKEKELMMEEPI